MRPRDIALLHEIERRRVAAHARAQKVFGQRARLLRSRGGARRVLGQLVIEACQLAARRNLDVVFFLL